MLGFLNKKTPEAESSSSGDVAGPLAGVRVENGKYVFEHGGATNDNVNVSEPGFVGSAVLAAYGPDKFHKHLVGGMSFVGRKKGLTSLQVDPDNDEFRKACEVAYRRLADSWAGPLLDKLGNQAVEDLIVITIGFGPVVKEVAAEVAQKKRAVQARKPANDVDAGGGENEQEG